ncbi:hypothetical protein E3N88_38891 [Mikania micrantha]|uniref:Transposase-associated domain-containing protein n=1 Tax=Mikania micrantha TaxID=192012 RepID=A0A5N6LV85_9ASTR|nr:hypothetical protein E3N88_38891 [Mikania micrantha]
MDRSWMYHAPRSSQIFVDGVKNFLNFAFERKCNNGWMIKCPCRNCLNMLYQNKQSILHHLICSGFRLEYLKWVYHGEGTTFASTSTTLDEEEEILHHEMHYLLNDAFEAENADGMEKWRAWKGSLKVRLYDPSLTVDEIVAQHVKNDKRASQTQFKELATRWFTPKFQGKKGV